MVLTALLLSACGGGDGSGTAAPTTATSVRGTVPTIVATTVPPTSVPPSPSTTGTTNPGLSSTSTVNLHGIGPVRVGMTVAEASTAAGRKLVIKPSPNPQCAFADPEGGPQGVTFMVISDRVARVDVRSSLVRTLSGAGVGDTAAQTQARYSNTLQVSAHNYVPGGKYLTLVPTDAADANFGLIFETDASAKVTRYRAGKQPEVSYIEGCS